MRWREPASINQSIDELTADARQFVLVGDLKPASDYLEWSTRCRALDRVGVRVGSALSRAFEASGVYRSGRPWEAIEAHAVESVYEEAMVGAVYLSASSAPGQGAGEDVG